MNNVELEKLAAIRETVYQAQVKISRALNDVDELFVAVTPDEPSLAIKTPWMDIAMAELGVKEVNGKGHNPRILEYLQSTTIGSWGAGRDETAWCSAFVNWVMEEAGIEGTNSAMARSWLNWGRKIDEPVVGCIVVLKRGTGNSGHVAFCADEPGNAFVYLLGGNQSDSVCVQYYKLKDVLGYRLPA